MVYGAAPCGWARWVGEIPDHRQVDGLWFLAEQGFVVTTHTEKANRYIQGVLSGEILSCKWIKLACQRQVDDLARTDWLYVYDPAKGERICKFIELFKHTKGEWASKNESIRLEDWQCFLLTTIFGWVHKDTGKRRFRKAMIVVPRKSGKSVIGAGIGLYMLAVDGEAGSEVYCGATSEKQAWEVFRPAKIMAAQNPAFLKKFGVAVNASNINVMKNASRFEPLIGNPGDGSSPHLAILDEYHEHQTPNAHDTMVTGMGARSQPMMLIITTAGDNLAGPCYDEIITMRKIMDKVITGDDRFYAEWTIDADVDWQTDQALRMANPNFDVSVSGEFLRTRQKEAIENARHQNIFKTKHLNVWCSSRSAYFNMQKWADCTDSDLTLDDFEGKNCFLALDLASKVDISAKILLFPLENGGFAVFGTYYLPEGTVESTSNNHYRGWVNSGHMVATDGDMIDMDRIEQDILDDCKRFNVQEVVYDPFQATMLVTHLQNEGVACVEYRATVQFMSEPTKNLDGLIMSGKIKHDGDPVLTWMMSNVVCRIDAKDCVYPVKERAENKIDGAIAFIMALGRALVDNGSGESVYEERGILVL
jgi:phage terminase large subunit-like protein